MYVKFFVHKFLRDLQSFHFVFKITILIVRDLILGCSFINRLLTSAFFLVNRIVFRKSNGLIIKVLGELPRGKSPLVRFPRGEFPRGKLTHRKLPRIYQCIFIHHSLKLKRELVIA